MLGGLAFLHPTHSNAKVQRSSTAKAAEVYSNLRKVRSIALPQEYYKGALCALAGLQAPLLKTAPPPPMGIPNCVGTAAVALFSASMMTNTNLPIGTVLTGTSGSPTSNSNAGPCAKGMLHAMLGGAEYELIDRHALS